MKMKYALLIFLIFLVSSCTTKETKTNVCVSKENCNIIEVPYRVSCNTSDRDFCYETNYSCVYSDINDLTSKTKDFTPDTIEITEKELNNYFCSCIDTKCVWVKK
jgi:hypothetical protein